jgi:hypothetical protein
MAAQLLRCSALIVDGSHLLSQVSAMLVTTKRLAKPASQPICHQAARLNYEFFFSILSIDSFVGASFNTTTLCVQLTAIWLGHQFLRSAKMAFFIGDIPERYCKDHTKIPTKRIRS